MNTNTHATAMCLAGAALLFLSSCEDNGPVVNDHELEMAVEHGTVLVIRDRSLDVRAKTNALDKMQRTVEWIVANFEPQTIVPVTDTNTPGCVVARRTVTADGYTLDTYRETHMSGGFARAEFWKIVSNGYLYLPLTTVGVYTTHNGEQVEFPGTNESKAILVRWQTDKRVWYRQQIVPQQGESIAALYKAYLDAGSTFPWKTNGVGE